MNDSIATFAQWAAALIIWGGYALALADWGGFSKAEKEPGRRPGWIWGLSALGLVLAIGLIRGLAFGWGRFWGFLTSDGQLLLVQASGLMLLIESGQGWAAICGGNPFPRDRRKWRTWPWRYLVAGLAAMLAWTGFIAWLVPLHESADLLQRLGIAGMEPWLQIPTAIALLTLAPIIEESLFRHYFLYRVAAWLAKGKDPRAWMPNAIVVTSLFFSVGHLGRVEPLWVKGLQVFAPGLILGWTAWKHGLERSIALHWGFNLCLLGLLLARGG